MKRHYRVLALVALVSVVAAACGSKPSNQGSGSNSGSANSKFLACQVTDTGGIDDGLGRERSVPGQYQHAGKKSHIASALCCVGDDPAAR